MGATTRRAPAAAAAAALTIIATGTTGTTGPAAGAPASLLAPTAPIAQVEIVNEAREIARSTVAGEIRARCRVGYELAEIVVDFSQGTSTGPSSVYRSLACDGAWHRISVTSFEGGFDPGRVHVTARMTVLSTATGDPAPQAVDEEDVWVRAATDVRLPARGEVRSGGTASLVVEARCDRPWVEPSLYVQVSQAAGSVFASAGLGADAVTCDSAWHRYRLLLQPAAGRFRAGTADVTGSLTVYDPEFFDPVAQTQVSRVVRLG